MLTPSPSPIKARKSKTSSSLGVVETTDHAVHVATVATGMEEIVDPSPEADTDNHKPGLYAHWSTLQRRIPVLKRLQNQILKVPPRYRWAFVLVWFGWKIVFALVMLFMLVFPKSTETTITQSTGLLGKSAPQRPTKLLYIVTTLSEYNTGTRATTKGQDRLAEVLIPVLVDGVQTMVGAPFYYEVDVYLICAYPLLPQRRKLLQNALPHGVGLEIWDNAAPLGYELKHSPTKLMENTRALARQHRYVIKDKFAYYDLFLAFEDDMLIKGHHVQHFLQVSHQIDQLRQQAPPRATLVDVIPENIEDYHHTKFFGDMTQEQLARVIPGFVRVEVLLNATEYGAQTQVLPVERDYMVPTGNGGIVESHIDPCICCAVVNIPKVPKRPLQDDLIIWETNIKAFQLRQLPQPSKDWVVLMMGPGKHMDPQELLGGYWSGRNGAFGPDEPRPSGGVPTLIAQQGGWMLTPTQIFRMHTGLCLDSFLPPYNAPSYHSDGQDSMNVEFWSGSYQIFTGVKGGCNMQRILQLDSLSKHFIYHVANNKQRQLSSDRMVRADHLWGQLNAVRKWAQHEQAGVSSKQQ